MLMICISVSIMNISMMILYEKKLYVENGDGNDDDYNICDNNKNSNIYDNNSNNSDIWWEL